MITIDAINSGSGLAPERQLTTDESNEVIGMHFDGVIYQYFTQEDKDNNTAEWQTYQTMLNAVLDNKVI